MEVIRIPGYTEQEKLHIAKDHLLKRVLKNHGLRRSQVSFTDEGIRTIIGNYTRESGVRNLERQMAAACRKVAKARVAGDRKRVTVTPEKVREYLGPQQVFQETRERIDRPGVATGLAVTSTGGEILFIESTAMPGKGSLMLTGQLGEVMKESAHAALSWIRTHSRELKIQGSLFAKQDIHIHVPQGAIPKDGPSAGIAMISSLVSLLKGEPVRDDVAMTGEITLSGKVLPVGGVKEKILAAKRAGIFVVILPERNRNDLEDMTDEAKADMTFLFAKEIPQALEWSSRRSKKKAPPPGAPARKKKPAVRRKASAPRPSNK